MAGTLVIDTLKASTGVLATQNGMTGIAKAWVNFTGSTATVNSSFNVSSVTRNAAGNYTINYTTAMPNTNYSISFGNSQPTGGAQPMIVGGINRDSPLYSTTQTNVYWLYSHNGGAADPWVCSLSVFA